MAGVVMSLVLSLVLAALAWLLLGTRLKVSSATEQNGMLNFLIYYAVALPIAAVVVFYGLQL